MAGKKITSTQVARRAGVSQATVSMILSHKSGVSFSRETIEKVESAARELGYDLPRQRNKTPRENRTEKLIVVFCPTLTSPYYTFILQGIEASADAKGYGVFICNTQRDAALEAKYLRMMRTIHPAGIIYTCNPHPDYMETVEELSGRIPLVIISNKEKTTTVDAINQDNSIVGQLMARHLLDYGHRDVAFITPPLTRRQWQRTRRVNGFVDEYERSGLKDHVIVKAADESVDHRLPRMDSEYVMGYHLTKELLEEGCKFTAIAGQNDMMAIGALDALAEAHLKVPRDVSVIGCDNTLYSTIGRISLTTVDQFTGLKGRDACDIVIRKIEQTIDTLYGSDFSGGLFNVEYTPKIIQRKTTSYAPTPRPGSRAAEKI